MKYLIITLFVLTFFIYTAYAFSYEEGVGILNDDGTLYDSGARIAVKYNSNFTTLKPSCQIVPIINQETISSGDNFSISFLLSCKGKIESNQLSIYFPEGFLSNEKRAYFSQFLVEEKTAIWLNEKPEITNITTEGAFLDIIPVFFMEAYPDKRITFGEKYSPLRHPPILFNAYSNEEIEPGDYTIKVIFQYSDGKEWHSSYEEVDIHVKELYEKTWGQILITIIGGIILAIIIAFSNIIESLIKKCPMKRLIENIFVFIYKRIYG